MIQYLRSVLLLTAVFSFLSIASSNQAHACTGHDLVINKITITSMYEVPNAYVYVYTYEIQNIGTAPIALNQIYLQNYVSANQTFENNLDEPSGGAQVSQSTTELAAGATYTGTAELPVDKENPVSSYPYFITDVFLNSETECDINNNQYVDLIEVITTGAKKANIATANVYWNSDTKSFSVSDWSGSQAASLQYTVLAASGTAVASGNTAEGQSTALPALQSGMYIVYLSDGDKVYSKKIIY